MSKRSSSHIKAQRQGKERDNFTCQVCGGRDRPEGHHIIDYQYGGSDDPDNIITLCKECHKKVHKGKIDIIKF